MRVVAALLLGALAASSQTSQGTRGGNDRILNLNQRIRAHSGDAPLRAILEERARLLAELIERPRLLTVEDAAVYLGPTKKAVQHMIAAFKLRVVKSDRRVFLDRDDLDEWIERGKS